MKPRHLKDNEPPYFSWDRALTTGAIKESLGAATGFEWCRLAAWIMREARFSDVWQFLNPREVSDRFQEIEHFLGRKKAFWNHILRRWHELGKI